MTDYDSRYRTVTAVLGPTNTGKTHLAIERMLDHETGMIGLPLRLLAREVYDRIVQRVGIDKVALVTGEEKIKPDNPRYWVSTVEAMPRDVTVDFLAIDEIQLAADPERGHVFTDRMLHARGRKETLMLGAGTMRDVVADLVPGANFVSRPRLSKLVYAGQKKITRLPKRSAIVAFSAAEVYAIAELIRRQLGGAAVVLGALSPRTRNAQVALYQSGDVDYMVATDAIGMGLNLNVDHVAFSAVRKFDGQNHRNLTPGELAQIAGRAGRHLNDGSFGVTADVEPFDNELVERLETHNFEPIKTLQWRSRTLDFASLEALRESLRQMPNEVRLQRARMADDLHALEAVSSDRDVLELARNPKSVSLLWDVCQIPDYRKISSQNHADLVANIYKFVADGAGHIPEDWLARQVAFSDRTDGDIDTLSTRLAHIRTWTFVANRPGWLADPEQWQGRTRAIEDSLSDALHDQLTQRFVDRRTSALMKGMRDKVELEADIADDGAIKVEDHFVGRLKGFRFAPDATADSSIHGRATRQAASQVVSKELAMRARRVAVAKVDALKLSRKGTIIWRDEEIARLEPGDDAMKPTVVLLVDELLSPLDREKVQERLNAWVAEIISDRMKPLVELTKAEDVTGLGKGIAFRLGEHLGVLKRETIGNEIKSLDQAARGQLRKYGVRFGAFNIFFQVLLKPAASELRGVLWTLKHGAEAGLSMDALPEAPRPGLTSFPVTAGVPEAFYRAYGFHVCGPRVVRVDILERLADLIRVLVAWRPAGEGDAADAKAPPKGTSGDGGFIATPEMMSILGCSGEELAGVFRSLGFWNEKRPARIIAPAKPKAAAAAPLADDAMPAPALSPIAAAAAAAAAEAAAEAPAEAVAEAAPPAVVDVAAEPVVDAEPAVAVTVAAETTAEPVTVAEPQMEDVWRPRRRGRPEARDGAPAADGERQARRGRRGRRPDGDGAVGSAPRPPVSRVPAPVFDDAPVVGGTEAAPGVGGDTDRATRPEHRRGGDRDRQRPGGRPGDGGNRQGHGDRDGQRRPPGGGGDQRRDRDRDRGGRDGDRGRGPGRGPDDRRREERSTVVARSGPPPRKGTVDPDSPFAALSALKQALEKQAREPK